MRVLYLTYQDVLRRVRKELLLSELDFDRDGVIDGVTGAPGSEEIGDGPLGSLVASVCTEIDEVLGKPQGNYAVPFAAAPDSPDAVKEVALDLLHARIGAMAPAVVVVDHVAMAREARKRLDEIRNGRRNMGQAPPDPPANVGGALYPSLGACKSPIFGPGKWGIF